jgi:uncharacterized protein YbaA (DUF1428 family)
VPAHALAADLHHRESVREAGHRIGTTEFPMRYVDGYVLPVPKRNLQAYRRMAQKAGKIWRELGALEFRECAGDDLAVKMGVPFPRLLKLGRGETAMFSWIVYKSRADRDRINAKVMKDPRIAKMMKSEKMPFDYKRMVFGGFKVLVDL